MEPAPPTVEGQSLDLWTARKVLWKSSVVIVSCLGKSLNFSEPQFLQLQMEIIKIPTPSSY